MKILTNINDVGIYPTGDSTQSNMAKKQKNTLTDVSLSDFIILFLKQEGQDMSLLRPTIGNYTKAKD